MSSRRISEIWQIYSREMIFGAVLFMLTIVCCYASQYINATLFDSIITPLQNIFNIGLCCMGAVLIFAHSDGMRFRKSWAWSLTIWGILDLTCVVLDVGFGIPLLALGSQPMSSMALLVCNLLGWLLTLYPTEILRPGWISFRRVCYQLLPMIAVVIINEMTKSIDLSILIALYPVLLVFMVFSHLRAYRTWCEQNYSTMQDIDVQSIVRILLILVAICGVFFYMCISNSPTRVFTQQFLLSILIVYGTEQILFRRDPWAHMTILEIETEIEAIEQSEESVDTAPQKAVPLSPERQKPIAVLEKWMKTDKPYLNPAMNVTDIQHVLSINRTYISQLLRDAYGKTFYQYINSYRVEEAKQQMIAQPKLSMQAVADSCGFSSRRLFYQVFTRETGLTPSQWRDSQGGEVNG